MRAGLTILIVLWLMALPCVGDEIELTEKVTLKSASATSMTELNTLMNPSYFHVRQAPDGMQFIEVRGAFDVTFGKENSRISASDTDVRLMVDATEARFVGHIGQSDLFDRKDKWQMSFYRHRGYENGKPIEHLRSGVFIVATGAKELKLQYKDQSVPVTITGPRKLNPISEQVELTIAKVESRDSYEHVTQDNRRVSYRQTIRNDGGQLLLITVHGKAKDNVTSEGFITLHSGWLHISDESGLRLPTLGVIGPRRNNVSTSDTLVLSRDPQTGKLRDDSMTLIIAAPKEPGELTLTCIGKPMATHSAAD